MSAENDDWIAVADQGRWSDLGRMVDDRFFATLLTDPEMVREALARVPEDWLLENPRYLYVRSLAQAAKRRFGTIDDHSSEIFSSWVASQERPATRDVLGVTTAQIRRLLALGRLDDAVVLADTVWSAIDEGHDTSGLHDVLPSVFILGGVSALLAHGPSAALPFFEEGHRWTLGWGLHPAEEHVRNHLAVAYALRADYRLGADSMTTWAGTRRSPAGTLGHVYETAGILARALIALGSLDEKAVAEILPLVDEASQAENLWWVAVHIRARRALYWGDRQSAASDLEHLLVSRRALTKPSSFVGQRLRADLADLYQASGNLVAADHVLATPGLHEDRAVTLSSRMRGELLHGETAKALAHFDATKAARGVRAPVHASWHALHAAALHHRGTPIDSHALDQIAASIERTDAFDALVEMPADLRDQVAGAIARATSSLPDPYPIPRFVRLTRREREVLAALRKHATAAELATALYISPHTAKTHLRTLYAKLGVHSRAEALRATAAIGDSHAPV